MYQNLIPSLFCILVSFGVPLAALILAVKQKNRYVKPFFIGALTFFVSQILLRLPLLQLWLANQSWFMVLPVQSPWLYSLLLGFSASVFEETGRYLAFRFLLKKNLRWFDGVVFGAGHGGIEAILLVGINYIVMLFLYGGTPGDPAMILFAGLERLSAMASHIGMSMLVLQSVRMRSPIYLIMALLIHGIMDSGIGILQLYGFQTIAIEAFLGVVGIALAAYTIYVKKDFSAETAK